MNNITTILLPAAGLGTRLFPTTFAVPKELFPLKNKPVIHYVLEEALKAGIHNAIIISSPRKDHLYNYLTYQEETCSIELNKEEKKRLESLNKLNQQFSYSFLIQEKALGVSNAILTARPFLKDPFFCMAYPDDLMHDLESGVKAIKEISQRYNASVILLEEVPLEKVSLYGIVSFDHMKQDNLVKINSVVEKPSIENTPSNLSIIGRYILSRDIFDYFDKQDAENPFIITAFNQMIADGYPFIGLILKSKRYDIGNYQGWVEAVNGIQ